ncbi:sugar phosphate permease [Jatrophihabitans sp. GAS493]|uniref:MFS transporter n=1 Tax=Jatrophihabitans sp. GAS493 TaxID=1907575 RepID=UPI000BB9999B|nr:MFS transporter [Jatrophihabitans sp. GAS493]SOD70868.1 sugar phosphate permease [Jatrophihabitans sp. GAS493]
MTALAHSSDEAPETAVTESLWNRQLGRYPTNTRRYTYLAITVLATVVLYYELYIQGAVATQIITYFHMTFGFYVAVSIVGNAVGALGSLAAGLADRWGRANMVVYGLAITGLIILFGLPHAGSKGVYMFLFAILSVVEGIVLVATPALVRDFSPQIGRASAMGFWTLGPVLGSLAVTAVSSNTLDSHPDWQFQFYVCGTVGLIVFVLAFILLRELSPKLRDQLMVTHRERVLVEARAAGLDPETALHGHWKQMMKADIIGPAFAISIFLIFYYVAVGFFVVYLATVFGYSESQANALGNWYWVTNAIALVVAGVLSDRFRVRKPFMIIGALVSAAGVAVWATKATTGVHGTNPPTTSYYELAAIIVVIAAGGGVAYTAWMAAFTETVEKHNPAATATGLAVWGALLRTVVTVVLIALTFVVSGTNALVDKGPKVQELAAKYHAELATAALITPAHLAALTANPTSPLAQVAALADITASKGVTATQIVQVKTDSAKYKDELATAAAIQPANLAALTVAPTDPAAQVAALADLTGPKGVNAAQIVQLKTDSVKYAQEIETLSAISPATLAALQANPTGPAAVAAVGQIAVRLRVPAATAAARLAAASAVPKADLALLTTAGPVVKDASAQLAALGAVPVSSLALLKTAGPVVQDAAAQLTALGKVPPADLAYLKANAADVVKAQNDIGKQWRTWWWICFAAQILFIPFVFLMIGRWSPKAAKQDAAEYDAKIEVELQALQAAEASS